jgi:hypothetical protein
MKTTFSKIIIALSVLIGLFLTIFTILFGVLYNDYNKREMRATGDDILYYNNIKNTIDKHKEINFENIFNFQWDKAYIVDGPEFSGIELARKLGIDHNLYPLDNTDVVRRIVFLYNGHFVYDFNYDSTFLIFTPTDKIIYKDTDFIVIRHFMKPTELKIKQ